MLMSLPRRFEFGRRRLRVPVLLTLKAMTLQDQAVLQTGLLRLLHLQRTRDVK